MKHNLLLIHFTFQIKPTSSGTADFLGMLDAWRGYMNDYDYIWGVYGFGNLPTDA